MKLERHLALGLMSASTLAIASPAFAQTTIQLGVGAEYSSGAYGGTEDVNIIETPFSLRVKSGNWSFRARIPFASIDGGTGVTPGSDDIGSEDRCSGSNSGSGSSGSGSGSGSGSRICDPATVAPSPVPLVAAGDRQGLGDITLTAAYSFAFGTDAYADVTGRVSLPTGDETKDLGTGESDYSLGVEVGRDTDSGGLYAGGGYRFRGAPPATMPRLRRSAGMDGSESPSLSARRQAGRRRLETWWMIQLP